MINIETSRTMIRQFRASDASLLAEISQEKGMIRWLPDWKGTVDEQTKWIENANNKYKEWDGESACILLAVCDKKSDQLMGMVGLANKEQVDNEVEIAYFMSEKYQGLGLTTEAAKGVIAWFFARCQIPFIMAIAEVDNHASNHVAKKIGFNYEKDISYLDDVDQHHKTFHYYRLMNDRIG